MQNLLRDARATHSTSFTVDYLRSLYFVDASNNDIDIELLPLSEVANGGKSNRVQFKRIDSNDAFTVRIMAPSGTPIENQTWVGLVPLQSLTCFCNMQGYWIQKPAPLPLATDTNSGQMSALDKAKLDGLPDGPDVVTQQQFEDLIGMPPETLSTIQELAAAIEEDQGALDAVTNGLAGKEPVIAPGISPQFYGWDKTWRQVQYEQVANTPILGTAASQSASSFATAEQGAKADTAVQPGELATVATSGQYADLSGLPIIPASPVNADWNSNTGLSQILNKPTISTVGSSGEYNDLLNKPTIPAAQVNSDWNSGSGVSQILNKPTLGSAASQNTSAFATASQGSKADTALQTATAPLVKTGTDVSISLASASSSGAMSSSDKTKLDSISTPIVPSTVAVNAPITNSGTSVAANLSISAATSGNAGSMSAADKAKLDSIATPIVASTVSVNAPLTNSGTTTAANLSISAATTGSAGSMSSSDKSKLDGISAGATNTPLSNVAALALGTATAGVSTSAARADHAHPMISIAAGSNATTAILIAGGSVDLVITLSATMPNTTYTAIPVLTNISVSILGTLTVTKKSQTTTTVTCTLKNTGLVSIAAGQTVEVIAFSP